MNLDKKVLIEKIMQKKEFFQLPKKAVGLAFKKFDLEKYSDEEKVKLTRNLLRQIFSGFSGKRLLSLKDKNPEWFLKRHLSTKERFSYYIEIYKRILKNLDKKNKISIIDLGAGINGFSYDFFKDIGFNVDYLGIEAVGQLVDLMNNFFKKEKINGKAIHLSLFETEKIKKIIKDAKKPRIVLLLKVVDSLEKLERDYSKKLLNEVMPLADRVVVSFATESWTKRKKFYVQRNWLLDFIRETWKILDDFNFSGERYLIFEKNI